VHSFSVFLLSVPYLNPIGVNLAGVILLLLGLNVATDSHCVIIIEHELFAIKQLG